jgi:D-glycero-D-manno-heptose 1,7-bisphosphate phosphatase
VRTTVQEGVPTAVHRLAELEILPGVAAALHSLRQAGFVLIVVTNQPDVARGTLDRQTVEEMHALLRRDLDIDEVACCYHDDPDGCACRKPRPGLLIDAAERLGIPLRRSFVVGDRWRDVEAGKRAGCRTILLRRPYSGDGVQADFEAADLADAAQIIVSCNAI